MEERKGVSRLARAIVQSVHNGVEDEQTKIDIRSCSSSESTQLLDTLKRDTSLLHPSQSSAPVLFSYWLLFIRLHGRDAVKCHQWDSFLFVHIGSTCLGVTAALFPLLKEIVRNDSEIAMKLFEHYFRQARLPLVERILSYYSTQKPHKFFATLEEYLKSPSFSLHALRLLMGVTTKKNAHIDVIIETKCISTLLKILQKTTDLRVLGMGIVNLSLILPTIPSNIPDYLTPFLNVLGNAFSFPQLPDSLQRQLFWFIQLMYGMYPLSFIHLLKTASFCSKAQPYVSKLKFHPGLLSSMEEELDIVRWCNKDIHQIVVECVHNDYFLSLENFRKETFDVDALYEEISSGNIDDTVLSPNELGALSFEGQKILQLQDLIEQKILYGEKVSTQKRLFSADQLETRFILLRSELLFERFLQKQYQRRLLHFQATTSSTAPSHIEQKISNGDNSIIQVYESVKLQNIELTKKMRELESKYTNWEKRSRLVIKESEEKVKAHEELQVLSHAKIHRLEEERKQLTKDYANKSVEVFDLETELHSLKREFEESFEVYKRCSLHVSNNLPIWEQNYMQACNNATKIDDLGNLLEEKEDRYSALQGRVAAHVQKISILSEQLQKSEERIDIVKAKHEEALLNIQQLEEIIKKQAIIFMSKIEAIETKCQTLRKINLALEKCCE